MKTPIQEWVKGLSKLKCEAEQTFIWKSNTIYIELLIRDDKFTLFYSVNKPNTYSVNKIEGMVDDLQTYFMNKTLKQLFLSLEE